MYQWHAIIGRESSCKKRKWQHNCILGFFSKKDWQFWRFEDVFLSRNGSAGRASWISQHYWENLQGESRFQERSNKKPLICFAHLVSSRHTLTKLLEMEVDFGPMKQECVVPWNWEDDSCTASICRGRGARPAGQTLRVAPSLIAVIWVLPVVVRQTEVKCCNLWSPGIITHWSGRLHTILHMSRKIMHFTTIS